MVKAQFRVLYRQFLFRVVDLEVLSSQGETSKLLGQFASLLVFMGLGFSIGVWNLADGGMVGPQRLIALWDFEHFLIATTMLVVGMFAVLSWDSILPDQRDVLVLAPLPVQASTIFLARICAIASGLAVTVATLNALPCLPAPLAFAPMNSGIVGVLQSFFAYWFTMFACGAFIFFCIMGVQGVASLMLSRPYFLRVSALLQIAAFCLFVCGYFLEPSLTSPGAFTAARNHYWLTYSPSYWFLGLFHQLNGSMQPVFSALEMRAWLGLAVGGFATASVYSLSYFRTLRRIAEEPEIVPSFRGTGRLPPLGDLLETAVGQFSIRTVLRSRKHRLILAFYLGLGFALTILFVKIIASQQATGIASAGSMWRHPNAQLLVASLMMMFSLVLGTRIAFAIPLNLGANWMFRTIPLGRLAECVAASRRALLVSAAAPVLAGWAVVFLWLWPFWQAAGHLVVLALSAIITAEISLGGFHKIPFTCSYLPGRSNLHLTFWICIGFVGLIVDQGAVIELYTLRHPLNYALMITILMTALILARARTSALAAGEGLRFEELQPPAILGLGLQ